MLDSALTCGGDSVVLTAPFSRGLNYAWEPAYNISALDQRSVTVWPDNDTIYTVYYLDNCGLEHTDTFVVSISPDPEIDLGNDTTLCTGENLLLEPELDQGNFSWSNDSTADTLMVDSSGLYILQVLTGPGCMDTDSIEVNFVDPPVVFTNPDTTICGTEEPYQLIAFPVAAETDYVWSTGDTAETLNVSSTGDYVIEAINGCSTATDTARIVFFFRTKKVISFPMFFRRMVMGSTTATWSRISVLLSLRCRFLTAGGGKCSSRTRSTLPGTGIWAASRRLRELTIIRSAPGIAGAMWCGSRGI